MDYAIFVYSVAFNARFWFLMFWCLNIVNLRYLKLFDFNIVILTISNHRLVAQWNALLGILILCKISIPLRYVKRKFVPKIWKIHFFPSPNKFYLTNTVTRSQNTNSNFATLKKIPSPVCGCLKSRFYVSVYAFS